MAGGRPSEYNPEVTDELCARLICGGYNGEPRSLRSVCSDSDMPGISTVFGWMRKHPEFTVQYARACEARADADAEIIREIADTTEVGIEQKLERVFVLGEGDGQIEILAKDGSEEPPAGARVEMRVVEEKRRDMIEHRKLRIDTRKWLMERMRPKKYRPSVAHEHTGADGGPIATIGGTMTPEQAAEAYAATLRGNGG
jgi:hypothetical protein